VYSNYQKGDSTVGKRRTCVRNTAPRKSRHFFRKKTAYTSWRIDSYRGMSSCRL